MRDLAGSLEAAKRQNAESCVKTTEDLARYRQVLEGVNPGLIVECGTFSGKSAVWLAANSEAHVITVDVHAQVDEDTRRLGLGRVTWFHGSSTAPEVIGRVIDLARSFTGPRMVILDSDHSAAHVLLELELYAPLVTLDSYCVVEDGIVRWMPWEQKPLGPYVGSPLDAIEQFVAHHPDRWEIDWKLEDLYPTTQFPSGWLRRIK